MKTIAFLCTIISVIFGTQQVISTQSTPTHNAEAIITTESNKGELTIVYEGDNGFTTRVQTNDLTYHVNETTLHQEHIIVYGYTINRPIREHQAFILFLDNTGQVIRHDLFNDTPLLECANHYILGSKVIFRIRESVENDDYSTNEVRNHFMVYDDTLTTYQKETIDSVIKVIDIAEDKLVMKKSYDAPYEYGLDSSLARYEPNTIYGAQHMDAFVGSVKIFTLNDATLDGERFTQQVTINYPGYHHIKTATKEITITLHPEHSIIENNQIYDAPLTIEGIQGRLVLNGQVIASGETIEEPGNYMLVIEGKNGYEKRLNFTVLSSVSGVYNNHVYDTKRTLTFNGTGYLNNTYIETGHVVNKPGLYTLDILGENDYRETLQFEIRTIEEKASNNLLLYIEIGLLASIVVTTATLLIKYKLKA